MLLSFAKIALSLVVGSSERACFFSCSDLICEALMAELIDEESALTDASVVDDAASLEDGVDESPASLYCS